MTDLEQWIDQTFGQDFIPVFGSFGYLVNIVFANTLGPRRQVRNAAAVIVDRLSIIDFNTRLN